MSMDFCIESGEIRKALAEIEAAEANGFMHCLAVFKIASAGPMLRNNRAKYSDLCEKAHPSDGNFDWGRSQNVTKRFRFKDGRLEPLEPTK